MTTMKEIAEQTGVSISTVSLVLNGRDEGRVNPALAKLVRNKATELGYKINPLARSLRTNKTRRGLNNLSSVCLKENSFRAS